jgi:hypothetical protein
MSRRQIALAVLRLRITTKAGTQMIKSDDLALADITSVDSNSAISLFGYLVPLYLYVDDQYTGQIARGSTMELEVEPGLHTVQVKTGLFRQAKSEKLEINFDSSNRLRLVTGINKNGSSGKKFVIGLVSLWILMQLSKSIPQLTPVALVCALLGFIWCLFDMNTAGNVRYLTTMDGHLKY